MIDKHKLKAAILQQLDEELISTIQAAENARLAATDDQSVAETQYDTLAIEQSYLAEGQSRRIEECKKAIHTINMLTLNHFNEESEITLGALIQLDKDESANHWYFLSPTSGGMKVTLSGVIITVITAASPLGQALQGKYLDDEIELIPGEILGFISAIA